MTDKQALDGGAAFACIAMGPSGDTEFQEGMTLRDYFAGQALQGIVAGYWANNELSGLSQRNIADDAYRHADAMIKARALSQAEGE